MAPLAEIAWSPDPVLLEAGPLVVRWYSLLFAAAVLGGYALWSAQMRRLPASPWQIAVLLPWAFLGVVVGARLGYCFLYEPATYLAAPWRVLQLRQGGLASHGAAAGLLLTLVVYARRTGFPVGELLDRASPSVALAAGLVRIGNLVNAEILGTPSSVPWAFRFTRGADGGAAARHPVQLYEAALAFGVLAVLLLVDRALGARRPRWLLAGLLLALYFGGRILVEPFKDVARLAPWLPLTTGQALSIPFALAGLALVARAVAVHRRC
jgi:phosphatidylglycerol:prolipoprotein diacylglycerol transferase